MNTFQRFVAVSLSIGFTQVTAQPTPGQQAASSAEGLSLEDWQSIRQAHEKARHAIRRVEEGYLATNHGQGLQLEFDGLGVSVQPKDQTWSWGLRLESYGFAGSNFSVGSPESVEASGENLAYRWDQTLEEWFVNDNRGLEHGFTVYERPDSTGREDDTSLVITMELLGGMTPTVSKDGRSATFAPEGASAVLHYSGLTVFDANGERLEAWLETEQTTLRLLIAEEGALYPLTIDPIVQQGYLKASNPGVQDQFGDAVAASGDTVVVGAQHEDSNSTGINGIESNNSATTSGAAYVFVRSGATWTQQAYLKASNTGGGDRFGNSVTIDGDTIIVGAPFERSNATGVNGDESNNSLPTAGAAYVFTRTAGAWTQQAYLKASNSGNDDRFGFSVAIDGDTAVIGAIFEDSNATGVDGDETDNSTMFSGAAYVFTRLGPNWTQQAYLKSHQPDEFDRFGNSVGISGDTIVVGAMTEASSATGVDGDFTDNGAMNSGAAYVFFRTGATWAPQAYLKASNTNAQDSFARSVAIEGDTIVIGAPFERSNSVGVGRDQSDNSVLSTGAVYVFSRSGGAWGQTSYIKSLFPAFGYDFGSSVSISGDLILVGSSGESSNATGVGGDMTNTSTLRAGAAFVFAPCGSEWALAAYLKASNPDPDDALGGAVSISGDTVILGARMESSNASGVDGDPFNNATSEAGAAYVFDLDTPLTQLCAFPEYCNGDGGDQMGCSDCPCSNNAAPGTIGGCLNSNQTSARLLATGDPSVSLPSGSTTDLRFGLEGAMPSVFSLLFSGSSLAPVSVSQPCFGLNTGVLSPAFDGLRCASLSVLRHGNRGTDVDGTVGTTTAPWGGEGGPPVGIAQAGSGFAAGQVRYFQVVYRDDPALSCMTGLNTTQAIEVTFTP